MLTELMWPTLDFGRRWPERKRKVHRSSLASSIRARLRDRSHQRCRLASFLLRLERPVGRGHLEAVAKRPSRELPPARLGQTPQARGDRGGGGSRLGHRGRVGASRTEAMPWIDRALWVQS